MKYYNRMFLKLSLVNSDHYCMRTSARCESTHDKGSNRLSRH